MERQGANMTVNSHSIKKDEGLSPQNSSVVQDYQLLIPQMNDQKNQQCIEISSQKEDYSLLESNIWTEEQKTMLFDLHKKLGNRWSIISSMIPGTTHNIIKNHFYCVLRRGFKNLNTFILQNRFRLKLKPVRLSILSKLLIVIDDKFHQKLGVSEETLERCEFIKDSILQLAKEPSTISTPIIVKTVNQLTLFNQQYRKKKKTRHVGKGTLTVKKRSPKKNLNTKNSSSEPSIEESMEVIPKKTHSDPTIQQIKPTVHNSQDISKQQIVRTNFGVMSNKSRTQSLSKVQIVSGVSEEKPAFVENANDLRMISGPISYPFQYQQPIVTPIFYPGTSMASMPSPFPFIPQNQIFYQPYMCTYWNQFSNQQMPSNWNNI